MIEEDYTANHLFLAAAGLFQKQIPYPELPPDALRRADSSHSRIVEVHSQRAAIEVRDPNACNVVLTVGFVSPNPVDGSRT